MKIAVTTCGSQCPSSGGGLQRHTSDLGAGVSAEEAEYDGNEYDEEYEETGDEPEG